MFTIFNNRNTDWSAHRLALKCSDLVLYSRGAWTYNIPDRMSFDWVFSSQWKTTEYDEDEDDVGEVMMMNEVVAGDSETKWILAGSISGQR